jgi:hypothetical protein
MKVSDGESYLLQVNWNGQDSEKPITRELTRPLTHATQEGQFIPREQYRWRPIRFLDAEEHVLLALSDYSSDTLQFTQFDIQLGQVVNPHLHSSLLEQLPSENKLYEIDEVTWSSNRYSSQPLRLLLIHRKGLN